MSNTKDASSIDWRSELQATALKFNVLIAWVAVVLNPIWAVGDYYNIPNHFIDFLIFRVVVSAATLIGIGLKKKLVKKPEVIALIPFLGISIQNAYMYSVMDIPELQTHTFAYIALFIGAGMFVLWRTSYSIAVVLISFVANFIFFKLNSILQLGQILINGGLLTASVALFTILLIYSRTNLTKKEIIARLSLAESNKQLAIKNKDIFDSINYAERIQHALLPSHEKIAQSLTDFFIFYKPKDVISGDFYWYAKVRTTPADKQEGEDVMVIAAVDCTGHGVPGALMSIIGSTILNQTLTNAAINTPAEALTFLNRQINQTLNSIKDGMDISLCAINMKNKRLQFAGANNPVYILRNKQLTEIKADKQSIGADVEHAEIKTFINNSFQLEENDCVYLFTDGYADQFGGNAGKKFKYKPFQDLLIEIHERPMQEQLNILEKRHLAWKGELEQVDDILVLGFRI
ncbi:MAG TPA: SpoIIE family protein phosphatase [Bacteroidia bacterium]|jgi:serine phosphatase RsbU (regulator of sigma subunit)|nr:SpoIIE family protein phosphatase [Bacteroidia bacterium]